MLLEPDFMAVQKQYMQKQKRAVQFPTICARNQALIFFSQRRFPRRSTLIGRKFRFYVRSWMRPNPKGTPVLVEYKELCKLQYWQL